MKEQEPHKSDKAGVVIFPPLLFFLAMVLSVVIRYLLPTPVLPGPVALGLGVAVLMVASLILQRAVKALLKHKTTVNPSGATTTIVKTGIFQFSRNPMYVSFFLVFIGVCILFNAWYGMLLLFPLFVILQKGIVEKQESYLTQKFGEDYRIYKRTVDRWI